MGDLPVASQELAGNSIFALPGMARLSNLSTIDMTGNMLLSLGPSLFSEMAVLVRAVFRSNRL